MDAEQLFLMSPDENGVGTCALMNAKCKFADCRICQYVNLYDTVARQFIRNQQCVNGERFE